MRVARYWAKAEVGTTPDPRDAALASGRLFSVWRGSDVSQADAQRAATEAAREWERRIARGESLDAYTYAMASRPEPLVEELADAQGARVAAVTINRVGCSVLNTTRVAFVDVDEAHKGGLVARVLGRRRPAPLDRLGRWAGGRPDVRVRAYATCAGYRYLLTAPLMEPGGDATGEMFRALGADERYATLCRAHRTFRARLSPKPWRLERVGPPPARFGPDAPDDRLAGAIALWQSAYDAACARHAVCDFIEEFGQAPPDPSAQRIVELHDAACKVGSGLPLA